LMKVRYDVRLEHYIFKCFQFFIFFVETYLF
jgi:hypothetical protein